MTGNTESDSPSVSNITHGNAVEDCRTSTPPLGYNQGLLKRENNDSGEDQQEIQRLNQLVEVIQDENNLLQLELQDVQRRAAQTIAALSQELENWRNTGRNANLEIQSTMIELTERLSPLFNDNSLKNAWIKLHELLSLNPPQLGETSDDVANNNVNNYEQEIHEQVIKKEIFSVDDEVENSQVENQGSQTRRKKKKSIKSSQVELSVDQESVTNKEPVALRRSLRKSVLAKVESKVTSVTHTQYNEADTSIQSEKTTSTSSTVQSDEAASTSCTVQSDEAVSTSCTVQSDEATSTSSTAQSDIAKSTSPIEALPSVSIPDIKPMVVSIPDIKPMVASIPDIKPMVVSIPDIKPMVTSELEVERPPQLEPVIEKSEKNSIVTHNVDESKPDEFYCVCGRQYLTKQKLGLHIRQFTCEWKFACKVCGIKYFEAFKLKSHMRRVHGEHIPRSHGCYYCGELFENPRMLFIHQKNVHHCGPLSKQTVDSTTLPTSNPPKDKSPKKVGRPVERPGGSKRRVVKKSAAKKRMIIIRRLESHDETPLESPKLEIEAPVMSLAETESLDDTNAAHKVDDSKDGFFCICGSSFTSKSSLRVHVKYYTFDAKFACSHCDKKYFSTCLLRSHMKTNHNIIFTGKDGCRKCGLCFPSRLELYRHCKNVHNCGPLMVNQKKKQSSPDPEPPVLTREDVPDDYSSSSDQVVGPEQDDDATATMYTIQYKPTGPNPTVGIEAVSNLREKEGVDDVKEGVVIETGTSYNYGTTVSLPIGLQTQPKPNDLQDSSTRKRRTPGKEKGKDRDSTSAPIPPKRKMIFNLNELPVSTVKNSKRDSSVEKTKTTENNLHQATEETINGTEVKCTCGKPFTTKSALLSHVKLKTRGNVFKCHVCSDAFPRRDYLRRHLKISHNKVKLGKGNAKSAKKSIAVKKKVDTRITIVPKRKNTIKKGKQKNKSTTHGRANYKKEIKCLCGMKFMNEVTLQEHLRLKIGKRVFKCDVCPEAFARYDYFKEHLRRFHQLSCEGMGCRDCGARGFASHKELREHRLQNHPSPKTATPVIENEQTPTTENEQSSSQYGTG